MTGHYFFENDDGTTVRINSVRYGYMITSFCLPAIEEYDLEMQDGATYHTTQAKETFLDRVISRHGDINWPPRSCDLTPLDCILCGSANV